MEPTAKERILKKIRKALTNSTTLPFPNVDNNSSVFHPQKEELEIIFAEEFTKLQGKFIYCENEFEFINMLDKLIVEQKWSSIFCWEYDLQQLLTKHQFNKIKIGKGVERAEVGLTLVECLIARTGTFLLSSKMAAGRSLSVFPPTHIAVAYTSQLVYDIKDALNQVALKYENDIPSMLTFATGPSRTADIEKTLVLGAHGPKEVFLFLIDDSNYV
ncbi:MAG: lactate utilization protein C [Bacteroidota bacterium]|jgi:L-lactate dehydrogenase complex protein LldG|nr:LUD domain-containing protein [Bacteroidota bacterium]